MVRLKVPFLLLWEDERTEVPKSERRVPKKVPKSVPAMFCLPRCLGHDLPPPRYGMSIDSGRNYVNRRDLRPTSIFEADLHSTNPLHHREHKDRSLSHMCEPVFLERRTDRVIRHRVHQYVPHMHRKALRVQPQHPVRPWSGLCVRLQFRLNRVAEGPVIQEDPDEPAVCRPEIVLDRFVQRSNDGGTDH